MKKDKIFFIVQSLVKYKSSSFGCFLRRNLYKPFFRKLGKKVRIMDGITIKYPSEIEIGDDCYFGEGGYIVGKGGLTIGDNFLMGAGSKIITSNHNYDSLDIPISHQGLSFEKVEIGKNVWFGFDVKVLGGSKISDDTIVGTSSMVNSKFFEKGIVLVGIPAKKVKKR